MITCRVHTILSPWLCPLIPYPLWYNNIKSQTLLHCARVKIIRCEWLQGSISRAIQRLHRPIRLVNLLQSGITTVTCELRGCYQPPWRALGTYPCYLACVDSAIDCIYRAWLGEERSWREVYVWEVVDVGCFLYKQGILTLVKSSEDPIPLLPTMCKEHTLKVAWWMEYPRSTVGSDSCAIAVPRVYTSIKQSVTQEWCPMFHRSKKRFSRYW